MHNLRQEEAENHRNIIIFCNEDLIANIILNFLLPCLTKREFNAHVFLSQKSSRKEEAKVEQLSKFNFLTKDYMSKILFPYIENELDNNECHFMTFNQLSREYKCRLYPITSTKQRKEQQKIIATYQECEPYISLSIRNNLIISSEIIKVASSYGMGKILNVHSSKLPERAGVWCALWDMAEGKSLHGTLHIVEEGIDTGSVIETYSVAFDKNYSYLKNLFLIYTKGAQIFLEFIDELARGHFFTCREKQDFNKRKYHCTPTCQDVKQMEDLGVKLFSYLELYEILEGFSRKKESLFFFQMSLVLLSEYSIDSNSKDEFRNRKKCL